MASAGAPPTGPAPAQDEINELRARVAALEQMRDFASVGVWRRDVATMTTTWSPQMRRIFGIDPAGPPLTPAEMDARLTPDSLERRAAAAGAAARSGGEFETLLEIVRPDGEHRWLLQHGAVEKDDTGAVTAYHGTAVDVTELHRVEEALRASETRYRTVIESLAEGVVVQDRSGRIVSANRRAMEILGMRLDEMTGLTSFDPRWQAAREDGTPLRGEDHPAVITLRTGQPCRDVVVGMSHPDGRRFWLSVSSEPLRDESGAIQGVVISFADITARVEAEREMALDRAGLTEAQHLAHVGSWTWDLATGAVAWTDELARIHGLDPSGGAHPAEDLGAGGPRASIEAVVEEIREAGQLVELPRDLVLHDGAVRHVVARGEPTRDAAGTVTGYRGTFADVTAVRELERRLAEAQRLEAIGRLAGGVAHDFNNLLTAINGTAELLAESMAGDDPRRADAEAIRESGERAAALARQLLAFGRRQLLVPTAVDLREVVGALTPMFRRTIGEDVDLRIALAADLPAVRADRAQLEQVLVNLVFNARDAMPGGGTVAIRATAVDVAPDVAGLHAGVEPGPFVRLSVQDSGSGIDPATLPHLFEPFFTTKELGRGTGLGLASVDGVVAQSGGWVEVTTEVGRGTTFEVMLPCFTRPGLPVAIATAPVIGGRERILLVEDEPSVRAVTSRILQGLGYTVVTASSPAEATALRADVLDAIDLLVSDIVMPGINGVELAAWMADRKPGLAVLLMSGYPAEVAIGGQGQHGAPFLRKPFTRDQLAAAVRRALDAPGA